MLLPFYVRFNEHNDVRICKNLFFFFLVCVSLIVFGLGKRKVSLGLKTSLVFLAILSFFNHKNLYLSAAIEQTIIFNISLVILYQLLTFNLDFVVIAFFLRISALIQAVIFILNYYGVNPYNLSLPAPIPYGSFGQQTLSGAHIAVLFPLFLQTWWWMFIPVLIVAVFLAKSAMAWASLVAGVVVFGCYKHIKRPLFVSGCFCSALIAFFLTKSIPFFSDNMRYVTWKKLMIEFFNWRWIEELFGRGLGWLFHNSRLEDGIGGIFTYAHNEAIDSLWAFGIIGTSVIVYVLLKALKNINEGSRVSLAILAAFISNSFGNFTFHISAIALPAMLAYAYLVTNNEEKINYGYNGY